MFGNLIDHDRKFDQNTQVMSHYLTLSETKIAHMLNFLSLIETKLT